MQATHPTDARPAGRPRRPRTLLLAGFAAALVALGPAGPTRAAPLDPDDLLVPAAPAPGPLPALATMLPGLERPGIRAEGGGVALALLGAAPRPGLSLPEGLSAPVEEAVVTLGPIVSGLPWRSGASCAGAEFATWRGRRLDSNGIGVRHRTFEMMVAELGSPAFAAAARLTPQLVVSFPLLARSALKQHAACAAGQFDGFYRQFGQLLTQAGAGRAIIRLGWEAAVGSGSHPWGIDTAADIPAYKACFRRAAGLIKSTAPGVRIDWSNAKRGKLPVSVLESYPGDDVVDLWGLHYYDGDAQFRTQALWDAGYNATLNGGPQGIGRWLAEATSRGKQLGIPEWGVWNRTVGPTIADDTVYIQNMFNFLRRNARNIAYENYFNCKENEHQIFPVSQFPRASALYQRLWSRGR